MKIDHKQKTARWAALEVEARDEIIAGLRDSGLTYRDISRVLGVRARRVVAALGEISALHSRGLSLTEISARVGLPRSTVHVLVGAARPLSTGRKTAVLAAMSQMHGMQVDTLGWFLGMERNHVYALVADLVRANEVHELKQVQPGEKWVVPTRITAARYLGWRPPEWQPPLMFAEHYRAVAQARVMLVGSDPQSWVSERTLRHRVQGETQPGPRKSTATVSSGREPKLGRPHIHDGRSGTSRLRSPLIRTRICFRTIWRPSPRHSTRRHWLLENAPQADRRNRAAYSLRTRRRSSPLLRVQCKKPLT
ncbi:helix-turn-helix domain-containing protein [Nocardia salmonicida]|uniref:helix-turn-helix domain-containing protein n=1 Tax=Nocardia salmonicida TaxID=53431 RepID=UPI0038B24739